MGKKKLEERLLLIKHINTYVKTHQKAYADWKSFTAVLRNIINSTEEVYSLYFSKTNFLQAYAALDLPKDFLLPVKNIEHQQQRIVHAEAIKKANNLINKKPWPPIEIFNTAAVKLLYPNSSASGIGKTFRKNFLHSKSLQIQTLSERACEGLCSDEDFDKTKSAANKEGLDDDSDEENEVEAVAEV
ncbi:unnamed protein product [Meloidogyne enterolobii]|uniref:Uncharacterized protein n=1 Tax=Meloidogyne enterolobii TaxID=390850 RepID=A0ACB1AMD3_MELEN